MRLIEIPDDGIIKEFISRGDSVVGKRRIDLSYMPTIKAEPVRHGRWESDEADVLFHCSACETQISTSWDYDCDEMWNYCPDYGAKMDGDNHGNVEM